MCYNMCANVDWSSIAYDTSSFSSSIQCSFLLPFRRAIQSCKDADWKTVTFKWAYFSAVRLERFFSTVEEIEIDKKWLATLFGFLFFPLFLFLSHYQWIQWSLTDMAYLKHPVLCFLFWYAFTWAMDRSVIRFYDWRLALKLANFHSSPTCESVSNTGKSNKAKNRFSCQLQPVTDSYN